MSEKLYKASEFRKKIGISDRTLWKLEYTGELIPTRIRNRRYYTDEQLSNYLGIQRSKPDRKIVAYSRVSSNSQKKELLHQKELLELYVTQNGKIADLYLNDIGSGINFTRPNFLKLVDMIIDGEVEEIIITYKDRLTRFGFELMEYICGKFNTKITVMNLSSTTPQEELVEDLMTIIHVFSDRLHGLRQYKSKIKNSLKESNKNETN